MKARGTAQNWPGAFKCATMRRHIKSPEQLRDASYYSPGAKGLHRELRRRICLITNQLQRRTPILRHPKTTRSHNFNINAISDVCAHSYQIILFICSLLTFWTAPFQTFQTQIERHFNFFPTSFFFIIWNVCLFDFFGLQMKCGMQNIVVGNCFEMFAGTFEKNIGWIAFSNKMKGWSERIIKYNVAWYTWNILLFYNRNTRIWDEINRSDVTIKCTVQDEFSKDKSFYTESCRL